MYGQRPHSIHHISLFISPIGWGYMQDRRADMYPHDRNVTDDLCSLIKLCFAFIMVNFST